MSAQSDGPAPPRARSALLQLALLAVLLGGVALVLGGLVPGAGKRLAGASRGWIAVEVVLELAACAGYAALFHGCFSYGAYRVPWLRSSQISIGELGAFAVVPTGIGGPVLRFWALLRGGMPMRTIVVRSVVHAPIFNAPYVAAALVLGLGVALGIGPGHAPLAVALAPLALVVAVSLLAIAATFASRRPPRRSPSRLRRLGREAIAIVPEGLRETPGRLRNPAAVLGAVTYWVGDCAVLWAAFNAAGAVPPLGVVVLAYMLGQLGNLLPLPGGVGGVEPVMLGVLTASGVSSGLAAAAVVLYRVVALGTQATLGAAAVATLVPALRRRPEA
jgi:uncharacterized membrane protein YbhN (UPF0104 family)